MQQQQQQHQWNATLILWCFCYYMFELFVVIYTLTLYSSYIYMQVQSKHLRLPPGKQQSSFFARIILYFVCVCGCWCLALMLSLSRFVSLSLSVCVLVDLWWHSPYYSCLRTPNHVDALCQLYRNERVVAYHFVKYNVSIISNYDHKFMFVSKSVCMSVYLCVRLLWLISSVSNHVNFIDLLVYLRWSLLFVVAHYCHLTSEFSTPIISTSVE